MNNLVEGEYIRTKNGEIGIFKGYNRNPKSQWSCKIKFKRIKTLQYYTEEYITKHSENIIDLIEEGDYINGKQVYSIGTSIGNFPIINYENGTFDIDTNIKSIVTKEQFERMEYKV